MHSSEVLGTVAPNSAPLDAFRRVQPAAGSASAENRIILQYAILDGSIPAQERCARESLYVRCRPIIVQPTRGARPSPRPCPWISEQ
eukprot:15462014-Alexandrium_andersonii.AAC.1